jgi:hypothetical protein
MRFFERGWERRLRKLEAALAETASDDRRVARLTRDYARVLVDALHTEPAVAARLFRDYDARSPTTSMHWLSRPGTGICWPGLRRAGISTS